jgi:hypothetical protein
MYLEEEDVEALRMSDPSRREESYEVIQDTPSMRESSEIISKEKKIVDHNQANMALTELVRIYEDARGQIAHKDAIIQELSYKLGKAETELANSVPVLEYKKNAFLLESAKTKSDTDAEAL